MEEKTLLNEGGVQVTTTRFVANGQTFALRNITAVRATKRGGVIGGALFAFVGIVALIGPLTSARSVTGDNTGVIIFGICLLGIGAYWIWRNVTGRTIEVTIASGQQPAFTTQNAAFAQRVLAALNDAIAQR